MSNLSKLTKAQLWMHINAFEEKQAEYLRRIGEREAQIMDLVEANNTLEAKVTMYKNTIDILDKDALILKLRLKQAKAGISAMLKVNKPRS